jgi:2-(1,2-epoxy-1,2-dihydrophenyl)acetyl-CoA isomerase
MVPAMTESDSTSDGTDLVVDLGADHVAYVEISRPPNNFFDLGLIARLADTLDHLAAAGDVRAVVLCSAGRHFCAGANFGDHDKNAATGPGQLYAEAVRLFRQPLPIVAAVQGSAIGGGLGLALAADFRVASPESRFAANFAQLGFHHGFGLSVTLPRVVGQQAALNLLYTGRRVTGDEARGMGLVDFIVPADDLRSRAGEFAAQIAAAAPLAVRSIRQTMRGSLADEVQAATELECREQERLMQTDDFREGLAAVAERRPGRFAGR